MSDNEILEIFDEFKRDYSYEKDSSVSRIITFFCLYINRQDDKTQHLFKDFFIRELATNKYNNQSWAVDVLIQLNDSKIIPSIFNILSTFIQQTRNSTNTYINGKILLLLIKLKDCDENHALLYSDIIEKEIKKLLFFHQDAFFLNLLVEYLAINTQHSLTVLSDYYATFTLITTKINESNIFIPCRFFSKNSCLHMKELLLMTYKKSQQAGLQLKKLFMDYAKYSSVQNREEWDNMQNMINELNSISLEVSTPNSN